MSLPNNSELNKRENFDNFIWSYKSKSKCGHNDRNVLTDSEDYYFVGAHSEGNGINTINLPVFIDAIITIHTILYTFYKFDHH